MRLSVIIVNYNVKFFLEQALLSVKKAAKDISSEILVVDNSSVDGSVEMVRKKFPEVFLIENKENAGFAKANNQAIERSKGEFILLLNPDTVVEEDTFLKCLHFMDEHSATGALGVKMLDGKGNFLRESKRSFPTPEVAFYKAFGLSVLFPRSKLFARYHLGHLPENKTSEVEVLSGAFMFIRKAALNKAGLLDEDFFMYGEDIDLSYRIVKAGYKNFYVADTRIIHYKGESTRKGTMNYVRLFYQAMIIFAQKHFSRQKAGVYIFLLKVAIYLRAVISLMSGLLKQLLLPAMDIAVIYSGMIFLKDYWQNNIKASEGVKYPQEYIFLVVPAYIAVWLTSVYFSGGYEKNAKPARIIRGLFFGTVIIAAIYAFLPETLRFSRAMILLGFVLAVFSMILIRLFLHFFIYRNFRLGEVREKKMIIVGSEKESHRVITLLNQAKVKNDLIGYVSDGSVTDYSDNYLGTIYQLQEIVTIYKIDEIIFCSRDVSSRQIIEWMTLLGSEKEYKIVPEDSMSIIGSNSKDDPGELYTIDVKLAISSSFNKRSKRLFDIAGTFFLLLTLPVSIFIIKNTFGLLLNMLLVLSGRRSWVGYADNEMQHEKLPRIKKGIITPIDELKTAALNGASLSRINLLYAKDYSLWNDAELFIKCYKKLGREL
ncbi:MAG: glycosyltransferase [Chitinophagales bacterium]|nr:glycosyltransferase [Chitinophagales bacterium]